MNIAAKAAIRSAINTADTASKAMGWIDDHGRKIDVTSRQLLSRLPVKLQIHDASACEGFTEAEAYMQRAMQEHWPEILQLARAMALQDEKASREIIQLNAARL